ncbi:DUF2059 domain-containing protein [Subsaximicrobium wynnwilliamsii]|uniref:DUF2059 domain-containing protein n=1 Tax=Subsaximicrobium wynnwilliamsii TaxID=291179 RepID=A0A5C6ZKI6_9FLAO|nr:DUF2059 domain-containing protein [Subsaximicrobium wynnwilliamsii]TXD83935.1 DUF2059 domain-containing protein [Subsaximicrobium wynnwilliamsii]TXD89675.1 DUF2059 domain-containing protein [Subsaximicrobium wynnwilliamsii]TXE01660.1 DUF2059 domain-containing protein [Subsaximicrobium wynnwilliamsii]
MKKLLVAIAFVCAFSVQAQEENSVFKNQTIEFIKLTGTADAFDNAIAQIGAQVPEAKMADFKKEANGTLDELYSKIADLYMKEFTEEDIAELVVFYKTDLGEKLASKQTTLTQSAMMVGQTWGMKVGQIAQKYAN